MSSLKRTPRVSVGQNLFRTSNLIGSCWHEALLFQSWGSLLVLFGLGLSIVFWTNLVSRSKSFRPTKSFVQNKDYNNHEKNENMFKMASVVKRVAADRFTAKLSFKTFHASSQWSRKVWTMRDYDLEQKHWNTPNLLGAFFLYKTVHKLTLVNTNSDLLNSRHISTYSVQSIKR